jgi:cytochrome b subunit of formate dehydrogenase
MGGVLPVVIMFVCALLIHRNLVIKRQRRRQLSVNQQSGSQSRTKDSQSGRNQQVLFMLLVQVLIYGILITPLIVWIFYSAITLNVPNKSPDRVAIEHFLMFIAELIIFAFPASSFYLYTLASQMFRAELRSMIRDILSCKWSNNATRIGPIPNENEIKTVTERLSRSKAIPPLDYSNRKQLEDVINHCEQARK